MNYLAKLFPFVFFLLAGLVNVNASEAQGYKNEAPMIYVARCGFLLEAENCGDFVKRVIFMSTDQYISFTDNWAVGREGNYKVYMSCLGPDDKQFIDGTLSLATIIVSGPDLAEGHDIATRLLTDFSDEVFAQTGNKIKCINH
jgi:hypothetical protein